MNNVVTRRFIQCVTLLLEEKVVRSKRQFALSLDYLPQSLSEIFKGRRDVTIELLRKSIEEYKINPVYIYTGHGPRFMTDESKEHLRVLTVITNLREEERITHVPVPAQSGYASQLENPAFIKELPTFTLPDYKYQVGIHRSFDASGDSMEPTLFEGDKVVCSFLEPTLWETGIKDNYVYVIVTRADVLIRRIFNFVKSDKEIELHSDNTFYTPYRLSLNEIREIWYVRAKISPFLPSPQNLSNLLREEVAELRKQLGNQNRMIALLNETMDKLVNKDKDK